MESNLKIKLKNLTNSKKYITNIISKYKENERVNDVEILQLLQHHPTKNITISNIDYLTVKIRKPFNQLALYYKYKNNEKEDDISYILCLKNLFGKYNRDIHYEEDVMSAFRNESHVGSKKEYFINNTKTENNLFYGICNHCKIETQNITTDHYPIPYKQIFESFIKKENIVLLNIDIIENDLNEIRINNNDIVEKWLDYHDYNANYRLLCKSCNSHFGCYQSRET